MTLFNALCVWDFADLHAVCQNFANQSIKNVKLFELLIERRVHYISLANGLIQQIEFTQAASKGSYT